MDNKPKFTKLQLISLKLIQTDFQFIYSIHNLIDRVGGNYFVALLPYFGLFTDGAEDWIKSYNNSNKTKLNLPQFNEEQEYFFQKLRNAIKLWDKDYDSIHNDFKRLYQESDSYFSRKCKPIASRLHLYDIFGVYYVNNRCCGNTILGTYYVPDYNFGDDIKDLLFEAGEFCGRYVACFNALTSFNTRENIHYVDKDYGGIIKSPFGNKFSDKFVLFSILCKINFAIECVEKLIKDEITTKLRIEYILYFYLNRIIPQINSKLHTTFSIDNTWYSDGFRNSMVHYKMGVALKEPEIIYDDPFYGLTQKYLDSDYYTVKANVLSQLNSLANQLKSYLHVK